MLYFCINLKNQKNMKKIYFILFACMAFFATNATTYTITIGPGNAYTPNNLSVAVGDMVVIQASSSHPTAQVDQTTWNANGTTPMVGGWGSQTTTFTFTATAPGTIYYVCQFHVGAGMKGTILVNAAGINETANNFLTEINVFPNPATTNVKVGFALEGNSTVNIKMMNVNGQEVKVFISDLNLAQGKYEYSFDLPQSIAAGNYFIEVSSGSKKSTKKILVTK
jgi:plastocyanin